MGPALLVLGSDAQEHGLKYSLLQRLHQQYERIGSCAESHCAVLLHNYRCHSGILMLPSSLFYNSTLQSMVPEDITHPDAPYPLLFVCSSLDPVADPMQADTNSVEAMLLLDHAKLYIDAWPTNQWKKHKPETICVMTTSQNQVCSSYHVCMFSHRLIEFIS